MSLPDKALFPQRNAPGGAYGPRTRRNAGIPSNLLRGIAIVAPTVAAVACASSGGTASDQLRAAATRDAVRAYTAMWHVMADASHTSNYETASLAQYADGDALELLRQGLYGNAQQHGVNQGFPTLHPHVTSVSITREASEVNIVDCFDDRMWPTIFDGTAQDQRTLGRHHTTATVARISGRWKVVELYVGGLNTC